MSDLESQLRRLKFHPLPVEGKTRILPANNKNPYSREAAKPQSFLTAALRAFAPSRENIWLLSPLVALWLLILALHLTTPDTPAPSGPSVNYAEFQRITLMTKLQIVMLENENRLPDCEGPSFSAPKHF